MYCPNKVRTPPVTSTSSGASGYVGQVVAITSTSSGGAAGWSLNTTEAITLQPGIWLLSGTAISGLTSVPQAIGLSTVNNPVNAGTGMVSQANTTPNTSIGIRTPMPLTILTVAPGTTQKLYVHVYNVSGTASASVEGNAIRIA